MPRAGSAAATPRARSRPARTAARPPSPPRRDAASRREQARPGPSRRCRPGRAAGIDPRSATDARSLPLGHPGFNDSHQCRLSHPLSGLDPRRTVVRIMAIRCRSAGWSETLSHQFPVRCGPGPVLVPGDPTQRPAVGAEDLLSGVQPWRRAASASGTPTRPRRRPRRAGSRRTPAGRPAPAAASRAVRRSARGSTAPPSATLKARPVAGSWKHATVPSREVSHVAGTDTRKPAVSACQTQPGGGRSFSPDVGVPARTGVPPTSGRTQAKGGGGTLRPFGGGPGGGPGPNGPPSGGRFGGGEDQPVVSLGLSSVDGQRGADAGNDGDQQRDGDHRHPARGTSGGRRIRGWRGGGAAAGAGAPGSGSGTVGSWSSGSSAVAG